MEDSLCDAVRFFLTFFTGNHYFSFRSFLTALHRRLHLPSISLIEIKEDIPSIAASIKVCQQLERILGNYLVSAQVAKDIWTAT